MAEQPQMDPVQRDPEEIHRKMAENYFPKPYHEQQKPRPHWPGLQIPHRPTDLSEPHNHKRTHTQGSYLPAASPPLRQPPGRTKDRPITAGDNATEGRPRGRVRWPDSLTQFCLHLVAASEFLV